MNPQKLKNQLVLLKKIKQYRQCLRIKKLYAGL